MQRDAIEVDPDRPDGALRLVRGALPEPGQGEVLVRVIAAGVSFADVLAARGQPVAQTGRRWEGAPGIEGAGVVQSLGSELEGLEVGMPVGWLGVSGSYASHLCIPVEAAVPLPTGVSCEVAAAAMLHGLYARCLVDELVDLTVGGTALVHSAAGGLGLWLCQLLARAGQRVVGVASDDVKASLALSAGAQQVLISRERDFGLAFLEQVQATGADLVFDGVGAETRARSLFCTRSGGTLVLHGAIDPAGAGEPWTGPAARAELEGRTLLRPDLRLWLQDFAWTRPRLERLFASLLAGQVDLRVDRALPLAQAGEAHRLLRDRECAGKLLLLPGV